MSARDGLSEPDRNSSGHSGHADPAYAAVGAARPTEIAHTPPGRHSARRLVECLPEMAYRNQIEILQGTLDMLILRTLQWGPQDQLRSRTLLLVDILPDD